MIPGIKILEDRKTVLIDPSDGEPVGVKLMAFPSGSTPGRIRLAFGIEISAPGGDESGIALVCPPWRIESN